MTSEDAPITLQELLRRLENMLRKGTIAAIDHDGVLVRVKSGNLLTGWLTWFERRAGNVRSWSPPSIGEQCLVISPGGEMTNGMVLVGLESEHNPAPSHSPSLHRMAYPDGAVIDYDHAVHSLTATLPGGGTALLHVPGSVTVQSSSVTLEAPQTTVTGKLDVLGLLTWTAGMAGSGGDGAALTCDLQTSGDVQAGGISLRGHNHPGVIFGGDNTGAAQ